MMTGFDRVLIPNISVGDCRYYVPSLSKLSIETLLNSKVLFDALAKDQTKSYPNPNENSLTRKFTDQKPYQGLG